MRLLKKIEIDQFTPYLVALFPLIYLYANNFVQIRLANTFRTLALVFIIVFVSSKLLNSVLKNRLKTSLSISFLTVVFLSFGHLSNLLPSFELFTLGEVTFGKNKLLLTLTVILACVIFWKIFKAKKVPVVSVRYIAFISVVLIIFSLARIGFTLSGSAIFKPKINNPVAIESKNDESLPDVYYIVLDGHARQDVLAELYGLEKNALANFLNSKGFYVADQSRTNYIYSYASLASSLNFDYLENLDGNFTKRGIDYLTIENLIQNNRVSRSLKELGYSYITFRSGFVPLQKNPYADTHIEYTFGLNNFERVVINNSIMGVLLSFADIDLRELHRRRLLFSFDSLAQISLDKRPTFTFAHFLAPHPPFVFDADGSSVGKGKYTFLEGFKFGGTKEQYKKEYLDQLIFIDKKLIETIEAILENSLEQPIIIIQSDHGPASEVDWTGQSADTPIEALGIIDYQNELSIKERTSIFNAYFLPKGNDGLYDTISPVNSFRIVFNRFFNQNLELLEDKTIIDK
jgi:hypothetical protein